MLAPFLVFVNTIGYGVGMNDRLDRQSWLDAGLEQLAGHGPSGLRIVAIAQKLGVTKGSFYWHFRNQNEYLASLLQEWERSHTQQIIDDLERTGGSPAVKLRRLMLVTVAADPRLSLATRAWAHSDTMVGKAVKRVDKKRLAYVAALIEALGWPQEDAATLARWSYCALVGHFGLGGSALTEQQIDLILGTIKFRPLRQRATSE